MNTKGAALDLAVFLILGIVFGLVLSLWWRAAQLSRLQREQVVVSEKVSDGSR